MYQGDNIQHNSYKIYQLEAENWAADLSQFAHSLFLAPEWIESVRKENDIPIYLNISYKNEVVGKISGLIRKFGYLKGCQFYSYASFALKESNQLLFNEFHNLLLRFAVKNRISRIIIGSYDQQNSLVCQSKKFYTTKRLEYHVDLKREDIHFSKGFRKNARKAQNNGFEIKKSDSESIVEILVGLLNSTRQHRLIKYGVDYNPFFLPGMDEETLKQLVKRKYANLVYATKNGEAPSSIQINLIKDNRIYGLLMGSNDTAYELGIPSLIDLTIIQQGQETADVYYNTGGIPVNEENKGLAQYKEAMGGEKKNVFGATTNYLTFPYKLLNPIMALGRKLPTHNPLVEKFKSLVT